ncbi:cyclin family protein [Rhodotorula paludigena]|uniref:cyclin family protein n=1 Tax=Rhodotorula paludigena TaxID=86838 RepID=UPI00316EB3AB
MPADRYYGFEDLALLCEHVISSLFSVATQQDAAAPAASASATPAPAPAKESAAPQLGEFIAYALYRTRLPVSITHQALLLLTRLKQRYPSARGTSTSPHRLFLSSLMLSSKISMDDTYSNKSWQIVGQGLFELREVNQMERELFAFLGWNVVVRDEELEGWVHDIVTPYEAERELARSLAVAAQQQQRKSMEERKRRRDSRNASPTPSTSRSPSPNTLRHRRASDAAVALLRGNPSMSSMSSLDSAASSGSSSRSGRMRHRSEYRTSSPYSRSSSRAPSTVCSSYASSPAFGHGHGVHTPISPCTPAGPLTPESAPKSGWPLPQFGADAAVEKLAAYAAQNGGAAFDATVVDPASNTGVIEAPPTW